MAKELEGPEESPKAEIHIKITENDNKKNIKLENARSRWNTWILFQEIHHHS